MPFEVVPGEEEHVVLLTETKERGDYCYRLNGKVNAFLVAVLCIASWSHWGHWRFTGIKGVVTVGNAPRKANVFFSPESVDDVGNCLQSLKFNVNYQNGGVRLRNSKVLKAKCSPWDFPELKRAMGLAKNVGQVKDRSSIFYSMDDFDPNTTEGKKNLEKIAFGHQEKSSENKYPGFFEHHGRSGSSMENLRTAHRLLQKMFARNPPPSKGRWKTCAIVGASDGLDGKNLGSEIDSHDAVIRVNDHPTIGFEDDVGRKTTFRIIVNDVLYSILSQVGKRTLAKVKLPSKCIDVFSGSATFNYWASTERTVNYAKNRNPNDWMGCYSGYKENETLLWHGFGFFPNLNLLKALVEHDDDVTKLNVWIAKEGIFRDRFRAVFPYTNIGSIADSQGEKVWRAAFGFCDKVSLYGFSFRGDAMGYKYYWGDAKSSKKIGSPYFLAFMRSKWPNSTRPYDPDKHCRRSNIARLAVAGCMGLPLRFGDGPEEYLDYLNGFSI